METLKELLHLVYFACVAIEADKIYGHVALVLLVVGLVSYGAHKYQQSAGGENDE